MNFQIGDRVRVKDCYGGDGGASFRGREGTVVRFYGSTMKSVGVDFGVPSISGYPLHDLDGTLRGRNEGWFLYAKDLEMAHPKFTAEELSAWDAYDQSED